MRTAEERFWAKVEKTSGCWNWTARKTKGYGKFWLGTREVQAHRFSYELANGPIPAGKFIDHRCHNGICVNPKHLRVASNKQNMENLAGARSNTGVRGVTWNDWTGKYVTAVGHNGKQYSAGHYNTLAEAEAAVVAKRNELFTHNDADRAA
jgi:hypothetical protein